MGKALTRHILTCHPEIKRLVIFSRDEQKQYLMAQEYPTDKYSPSCLIYGVTALGRVLHVQSNHQEVIVTVYDPDPTEWVDLKWRRKE